MRATDLLFFTPLANHLWQSTVFVGVIWLLTLVLKKNRAAVRCWMRMRAIHKNRHRNAAVIRT